MKIGKWIWACTTAVLCIAAGCRYCQLNRQYPPPEIETYAHLQPVKYNDIELVLNHSAFLQEEEIKTVLIEELEEGFTPKMIVLDVTVTNTAETEQTMDFTPFILESGAWKNAVHMMAFLRLNDGAKTAPTMTPILQPGESLTLRLPFLMMPSQFSERKWDAVEERSYELVLSLYPKKRSILCDM